MIDSYSVLNPTKRFVDVQAEAIKLEANSSPIAITVPHIQTFDTVVIVSSLTINPNVVVMPTAIAVWTINNFGSCNALDELPKR